jgi:hypothetical protein
MRWTKSSKYWENRTQQWLVGGIPTPLKNIKVSWDDEIPNIWKNKFHVPNHQPDGHITRKTLAVKPALLHIPT